MKLTAAQRTAMAASIPLWIVQPHRDAIERRFTFSDFSAAFSFMTEVAVVAEEMNHHPEWFNVWNTVDVVLSTHDVGGLSTLDIDLAQEMDKIYQKHLK